MPVRIVADEVQLNLRTVYGAAAPLLEPLATIAFAAVLVIFFLLGREDLRDRMMSVFGTERLA